MKQYGFNGGYITFQTDNTLACHYYTKDHLGNNRVVVNENGTLEQVTHYYAFGGTYGDLGLNPSFQKYKFNGKELDRMHGLDWYDYGSRRYDAAGVPMFTSIDPRCENNYYLSPYTICADNPVIYIDNNGEIFDIVWDLANVAIGLKSLYDNVKSGNYMDAVFDGVGVIMDATTALVPGVPGGVGTALKINRAADITKIDNVVAAMKRGLNTEKEVLKKLELTKNTKKFTSEDDVRGKGMHDVTTIPDAVDEKSIYEIKDVKYQGLTKQIKAEMETANKNGKNFILIVRKDTELSDDLRNKFLYNDKAELLFIEDILGLPPHK